MILFGHNFATVLRRKRAMFLKCLRVYIKAILTFYLGLKNKSLPAQEFGFSIYLTCLRNAIETSSDFSDITEVLS